MSKNKRGRKRKLAWRVRWREFWSKEMILPRDELPYVVVFAWLVGRGRRARRAGNEAATLGAVSPLVAATRPTPRLRETTSEL